MKEKKFFLEHAIHFATLCAVVALILFIPGSIAANNKVRIFCLVMVGVLLVTGGVILYLAHRAKKGRLHYFLYDRRRQISLPASELSFDRIREGIDLYIQDYSEDVVSLWKEVPQKLRIQLEGDTAFLPLVAYRMLFELSQLDAVDVLAVFEGADRRAVGYLCRAIRNNNDADMADYIFEMKTRMPSDSSRISLFFSKNRSLFEQRMLRYVEHHFEEFYADPPRRAQK